MKQHPSQHIDSKTNPLRENGRKEKNASDETDAGQPHQKEPAVPSRGVSIIRSALPRRSDL